MLKGGIGLFYEPPLPLQIDPVFGTPGLLDSRDIQVDGGFEQEFTRQLGLSVDVFYKYLDRLIVPATGNSTVKQNNAGTGQAYGSEFLLRYKADEHFFGWVSYTISRSERTQRPRRLELPLLLRSAADLHHPGELPDRARLARRGALPDHLRQPVHAPVRRGAYDATVGTNLSVSANPPNSTRLPIFHELDIRIDKVWKFSKWQLTWYLDVENVYNYQAPVGETYNYNFTQSAYAKGLPILPSIGLRGEL